MYTQKQKDLFKQVVGKDLEKDKVNWDWVSKYQTLSEELIERFQDKVNWYWISKHQTLSEEFIERFQDKVNWARISIYQTLSKDFIEKFQDKVHWKWISEHQTLSEEFIEKFQDKVYWEWISSNQTLSEEFIKRFQDKVNWYWISKCQTLSEEFIEKFQDKVYWYWISSNQTLSEGFRDKFDLNKPDPSENWIEASIEEKLPKVKQTSFEIKEDEQGKYIEAYKAVRDNLSSVFQPGLVYEIGQTYQAHCDCRLYENNSFGLSGWTKNQAKDYHDERLLRVKIYVKDIGAIVHDGNKIRCFKQTILEEI